jgi:hypothetical protein
MTKPNRIQTPMRNCLFGKILLKKSSNDNFVDVCNDVEEFTNIEELFKVSTGYWPNPLRVLTMSALLTLLAEAKRDAGQSPVAAVVLLVGVQEPSGAKRIGSYGLLALRTEPQAQCFHPSY